MGAIYYYGQDGEKVDITIKILFGLDEKELRWSNELGASVYDFVGFVFRENHILVVFPKHYQTTDSISLLNRYHTELTHDIKLLHGVIRKYSEKDKTLSKAKSYIGAYEEYDSDYPFELFFSIYDHFQRYGLYKEKEEKITPGSSGKVAWKNTIEKAKKIVSNGNLIFTPIYVKKKNLNSVFITDCMAFIIDYTIEHFHNFLSLRDTGYNRNRFDYFGNIDFVISQLNQYSNRVFKDIHKQLIMNMISFFEQYKHKTKSIGGKIHVKIKYFDKIWQDMIGLYLNKHFVGIDSVGNGLNFDEYQTRSAIEFRERTFMDIDDSSHHFHIDIDHLAIDGDTLYIFDSKYYRKANHLNYKQYSYNEILRYYFPSVTAIYNALLLPGEKRNELHFSLNNAYTGSRLFGTKIIEQYLTTKTVMEDYLKN